MTLRIENFRRRAYYHGMEKRIITLEVLAEQTMKSIDRLDQSIVRLEKAVDQKFMWCVRSQIAALIITTGLLAKLANVI